MHLFDNDSVLLYSNLDYLQFYNARKFGNLGKNIEIEDAIAYGDKADANAINNSIIDTNIIETNLKVFYSMYLYQHITGNALSLYDSLIIEKIATQIPKSGGKAVYLARAFLNLEVDDQNGTGRLSKDTNKVGLTNQITVFPNPNDGFSTIVFPSISDYEITIQNSLGEIILVSKCKSCLIHNINLNIFSDGIYTVIIKSYDRLIGVTKLSILK